MLCHVLPTPFSLAIVKYRQATCREDGLHNRVDQVLSRAPGSRAAFDWEILLETHRIFHVIFRRIFPPMKQIFQETWLSRKPSPEGVLGCQGVLACKVAHLTTLHPSQMWQTNFPRDSPKWRTSHWESGKFVCPRIGNP